MLQLLLPKLPPNAIGLVSSQGAGEPDRGKPQGTFKFMVLQFNVSHVVGVNWDF